MDWNRGCIVDFVDKSTSGRWWIDKRCWRRYKCGTHSTSKKLKSAVALSADVSQVGFIGFVNYMHFTLKTEKALANWTINEPVIWSDKWKNDELDIARSGRLHFKKGIIDPLGVCAISTSVIQLPSVITTLFLDRFFLFLHKVTIGIYCLWISIEHFHVWMCWRTIKVEIIFLYIFAVITLVIG